MSERLLSEGFEHAAYALRNSIHNFRGPNVEPFPRSYATSSGRWTASATWFLTWLTTPAGRFSSLIARCCLVKEVKTRLPHGELSKWLKANFKGSLRTTRRYKRIAERWPQIEAEAKRTNVSVLKPSRALKLLTAPRKRPEPEPEAVLAHLAMPCGFVPVSGKALVGCLSKSGKGWVLTYLGHHF